jgi:mono/diheme cytochrome c family protein
MKKSAYKGRAIGTAIIVVLLSTIYAAAGADSEGAKPPSKAQLARGRYLLTVGSCNDCHTAGFAQRDGNVPEPEWLLGSGALGFKGPWGTTYGPNLRLTASRMTEAEWVTFARALKTRPPMPWFNLNRWSDSDLRALYQYIKSLGAVGAAAQPYLPPDQQPKPPYIQWPAPPK